MALTEQDIGHLARLAGLQLSSQEQQYTKQALSRILGLIEQLQAVDTTGIEPMAHPLAAHLPIALRLREDTATAGHTPDERAAHLRNAPAQHEGLFLVPTVIE
ncbi:Asp-tRNA(Asn)/Glu-tRNA(Gln) amidotransferase subunit GatC [Alcaligenaceae bacterium CGII-47]|nr:Asp-tRNA(Asn)/Glu-tRNA(Gln) amidotransferase subunit GatC [Alcaligenaceae bacterium CGII-47]